MSIADKLITIADNTSAVAKAVDAARVSLEGASIRAEGVAQFPLKVQLRSKNLLPVITKYINFKNIEYFPVPLHMKAGQKYTFSFQGEYTAWRLMFFGTQMDGSAFPYDISLGPNSGQNASMYLSCYGGVYTIGGPDNLRLQIGANQTGNSVVLTCEQDFYLTAMQFWVTGTEVTPFRECQLELGEVATPYVPYDMDFAGVGVKAYGKNLLSAFSKFPTQIAHTATPIFMKAGQKYTFSFKGEYTAWRLMFRGTQMDGSDFPIGSAAETKDAFISCIQRTSTESDATYGTRIQMQNNATGNSIVLTCTNDFILTAMQLWVTGTEVTPYYEVQLELGSVATDYEAYKTPQSATADSAGRVKGRMGVAPTMTVVANSGAVQVDYLPEGEVSQKYQAYKNALVALKEELV